MNKSYFTAIHQIITTGHWLTDQISKELRVFSITEPQYNVLKILESSEEVPCTIQKIQDHMVQQSSNVSRIIDKLLLKGYVDRQTCPSNRRKMDITLTDSGKAMLKKLDQIVLRFHQPMIEKLDKKELDTLNHLITKLTDTSHD
jgi:DNA-binding MarR family transcriptional regulator